MASAYQKRQNHYDSDDAFEDIDDSEPLTLDIKRQHESQDPDYFYNEQNKPLSHQILPALQGCHGGRGFALRFVPIILFWLFSFWCMGFFVGMASLRYPKHVKALPDLGILLMETLGIPQIPKLADFTLIAIQSLSLLRFLFHPQGFTVIRRFLCIAGFLYLLRCVFLVMTSLPDPNPYCYDYVPNPDIAHYLAYWPFDITCGDLMYSGHTVDATLNALFWIRYASHNSIIVKMLIWLVALFAYASLLISRYHYTLDITVAFFVTTYFFVMYHNAINVPPEVLERKSKILAWLEYYDMEPSPRRNWYHDQL